MYVLLILLITNLGMATEADPAMTVLVNGANKVPFDRFCSCDRLSNTTGKDVMVPHKSSGELSSFFAGLPTNVTKTNGCFFMGSGTPAFTMSNISLLTCTATSETVLVSGLSNAPSSATFDLSNTSFCTSCVCRYSRNGGAWTLVNYLDSINLCENDRLQFDFSCPAGSYTTNVTVGSGTFSVTLSSGGSCF
ncbi:MAG: hypothetical protein KDD37_03015 [Bdellovibrionales bacterium]|nr:hypothetical protein [Bdellovibrionales bacterium]